jgi:transcription elongation factor GreB
MSEIPASPIVPNYLTPKGYARLRAEWAQLMDVERPKVVETVHWAAKNGDRSENGDYIYGKRRLREIDRRIQFLTKRLELAQVVDASVHRGRDQIFFGASVMYVDESSIERRIEIVGVDEADSLTGQVSWVSPIARAFLKRKVGDTISLNTPRGLEELEIVSVEYPAAH